MEKKSTFPKIKHIKVLMLFFAMLLYSFALAQKDPFFDDISKAMQTKPRISFRIDSRNSFISNKVAVIRGYKIGLDYDKKIRLGLGFNRLQTNFTDNITVNENNENYTVSQRLHLEYISMFADYVFYKSDKWEFNLPIQLGGGYSYKKYKLQNKPYITDKDFVIIYEANINGLYKIFKWLGAGAGTGYRIMLKGNKNIKDYFNSPIYIFRVKIFPFEIIHLNKKHNEKNN